MKQSKRFAKAGSLILALAAAAALAGCGKKESEGSRSDWKELTTTQWMGKESLEGFRKRDKDREERIETENQVFNEQFDVYATDAHSAFYVVTPMVMERLLAMKAKYGSFGVAVSGSEMTIALCSGYYLFEPPGSYQEIENISVEKSADEIRQMLLFARLLENTINGKQTAG